MGIFAERAWCTYDMINKNDNSLTAFYSAESSWHIVITRECIDMKNIPLEIKEQTSKTSWVYTTPRERYWTKDDKTFPYYAIYLVPWTSYDDGDGTDGMIKMYKNTLDTKMTRIGKIDYIKMHTFLSNFQYPFLKDIRTMTNMYLFFHQVKYKKLRMKEHIIKTALRPDKLEYYFCLGYSIDELCDI